VIWLVLACKGPETNVNELEPVMAVDAESVDFGDVVVDTTGTYELGIQNVGRAPLTVSLAIGGTDAAQFSTDTTDAVIDAGDRLDVPLHFDPTTYVISTATLTIESDDPEAPTTEVPLTGRGVAAPTPDIDLDKLALDFGTLAANSQATQLFTVQNVGTDDLVLGTVQAEGSGAFVLSTEPSHQVIAAGGSLPVVVSYQPSTDDGDHGTLTIPSNDPDEPEVVVQLLGNGGGDAVYPVAAIDCPGESAPPQWIDLDGSDSFDPQGLEPLTYAWRVAQRPSGSQGALDDDNHVTTSLFTDVAGTYDVELAVTNTSGVRSAPARCTIDAIPADELHIELTWDGASSDLDLHLRPLGNDLFDRPGDCTWCNANTSWGARLDLDDTSGLGPENINVLTPANGTYIVAVHYFEDDGDAAVTATVRVYTYGTLAATMTHELSRNEVWTVGQVNWPDGTLGSIDTIETATARECQ
jgi:hypothetical protein